MKICFLYHSFFRHGGIQRTVAQLINHLCYSYDIELICSDPIDVGINPYHIDLNRISVKYLPIFYLDKISVNPTRIINILNRKILKGKCRFIQNQIGKFYFHKKTKSLLTSYLKESNCQVIVGCSMTFNTLLGAISSSLKCQVWGWEHNEYTSYFGAASYLRYQKTIYSSMLKNLSHYIVLTQYDAQLYEKELGVHTTVIPNALSLQTTSISDCKQKIILSIGRLDKDKQFNLLIDIFKDFTLTHSDWQLRIVGEGPEESTLKQKVIETNLENLVHILPYTEQIQEEYALASIYVSTSKYESFGLTVLEAMACCLPIVTFATTGPKALVSNNINGYIIPKDNKILFLNRLNELADNFAKRVSFGQNSLKLASEYSWEKIESKWLALLYI